MSFWATKVIDTCKKLDFFSNFRILEFWLILTTFDPVLSMKRIGENTEPIANENQGFTFLTENRSKIFQKKSKKLF